MGEWRGGHQAGGVRVRMAQAGWAPSRLGFPICSLSRLGLAEDDLPEPTRRERPAGQDVADRGRHRPELQPCWVQAPVLSASGFWAFPAWETALLVGC